MKHIKIILMIGIILLSGQLCAKVRSIMSQRDFEQNIAHKGICVALFYNAGDKKDSVLRDNNKHLQRMVEDVSAQQSYDDADVAFIKINTARKEFDIIMRQYGITQVPQFILFRDGRRVIDEQGNACVLSGFVTREALESFIDTYCGVEIKRLDVAKDTTRERRMDEEKRSSWRLYFEPRDIYVSDYDPAQRDME